VARKGEPVHAWMGIADGLVKITDVIRSGKVVMFSGIPAGAWVGEGSVFKRELRRYDIVAVRQTRVIHVPRATFRGLLDTGFEFDQFIIEHLNERLGQFMAMVEADRMSDPIARVAGAIARLYNPVLSPGMGPFLPRCRRRRWASSRVSPGSARTRRSRRSRRRVSSVPPTAG